MRARDRSEDATLLAVRMGEGATGQGMLGASEAGNGKEMDSPLEPPKEYSLTDTFLKLLKYD